MIPQATRDKLPELHRQSSRFFSNWLATGVAGFIVDGLGRSAFPGAGNYVGWAGAIEEDLAIIYGALDRPEKSAFRQGLVVALVERSVEDAYWPVVTHSLLRLAGLIKAPEVIEIIPALLQLGQNLADQNVVELNRLAFDVAVELAVPVQQAERCLLQLISSPGFRFVLAGPALIALTRTNQDRFAEHLDILSKPLNAQYHPAHLGLLGGPSARQRDELILAIAKWTTAVSMASAFDVNRRETNPTSDWVVRDWFCRGLYESENELVAKLAADVRVWSRRLSPSFVHTGELFAVTSEQADEFDDALGELLLA